MVHISCAVFILSTAFGLVATSREEATLLFDLFSRYDKNVRPVANYNDPLDVHLGILLNQLVGLHERDQFIVINIWFRLCWTDHHLQWNPAEYKNVTNFRIKSSRLWIPDITLYNSADETRKFNEIWTDTNAVVMSNGSVTWSTPVLVKSSCKVDVRNFPFDRQRCRLKLGSWSHDGFKIDVFLADPPYESIDFISNGGWELVAVQAQRNVIYYECCKEPYPDLTWTIVIQRYPLFFVYYLLCPCFLVTALGVLVFYLPPESAEKAALGVTVLLSMVVFLLLVAQTIPATSECIPVIGQFFGFSIVLLATSTALTVVILNLHFYGEHGNEAPRWLKAVAFHLSRAILMQRVGRKLISSDEEQKKTELSRRSNDLSNLAPYCSGHFVTSIMNASDARRTSAIHDQHERSTSTTNNDSLSNLCADISVTIRTITEAVTERLDSDEYKNMCKAEWEMIALILDRCFLIIFLLASVIASVSIFTGVRHDEEI